MAQETYAKARKKTLGIFFLALILALPLVLFYAPPSAHASAQLNPIQQENLLPGTTAWQITNPAAYDSQTFRSPDMEGYAWQTSAIGGDTLTFSVSTTAQSFTANLYRLGWYQGNGGRLITTITNITGHFYPMPTMDLQTGLIEAQWPAAFTIPIDPAWVSGLFLVKLTGNTGKQAYIPFVIRSTRVSDFTFIHGDNTDEAYNAWGGASLYVDDTNKLSHQRALKVSFDRPYRDILGSAELFYWEYPMLRYLEQKGYDLTYMSGVDVDASPGLLLNHHGILVVGHDEYWSQTMRNNVEAAVNAGVSLANFAANSIYWQIRYEAQTFGNHLPYRVVVCYKSARLDPLHGKDNSDVTVQFRDKPVSNPEQSLLGSMYADDFGWLVSYDYVVTNSANWIYAGTGLNNGDHLAGIVGYESDKVFNKDPKPGGLTILSVSPIVNYNQQSDRANSTIYTAASGARVFNAGTIAWSWGVDSFNNPWDPHPNNYENPKVQMITDNILQNFITGHPTS